MSEAMAATHTAAACAVAVVFIWLGMIGAISFLEAPLKFRAPGITTQLGLGIGRIVFRMLNTVEAVLATLLIIALLAAAPPVKALAPAILAIAMLAFQLVVVRPRLSRHADAVLTTAHDVPGGIRLRSHAHYAYIGAEIIKAVSLLIAGILLLQFILTCIHTS